jgi:glycosyltransferase involved in cell wall biosynthesis
VSVNRVVGSTDLVSVVIPTLHRPGLVARALGSVLNQTHRSLEVVVIVDGPDPQTVAVLQALSDPRVHVIVNPSSLGPGGARDVGADAAVGHWLAFLDDDDEWLPTKLERQLALAVVNPCALISCLCLVKTPIATYVWPREIFNNITPLDEYLFDRRSLFAGATFIQTSTFFLPRTLYEKVRFKRPAELFFTPHDDWDFILRLSKEHGARIETIAEVLAIYHAEEQRDSIGRAGHWSASLKWIESISSLITPRAYSGFCLVVLSARAANQHVYSACASLLRRAYRRGSPTPMQLLVFLGIWLVPQRLRWRLRALAHSARTR